MGIYDTKTNRWAGCPNLSLRKPGDPEGELEVQMAHFLNQLVEKCIPLLGKIAEQQRWTAEYSASSLLGHDVRRKPDLVLLDNMRIGDWRCVHSFGKMKSSSKSAMKSEMFDQITGEFCYDYACQ